MLNSFLKMGVLRNLLHGAAIVCTFLMPLAIEPDYTDDWNLFFSGILPATAPLIVIVIGLDTMMSQLRKSDADEATVRQYNLIIGTHLLVGGLLLAAWLAVFLPVLV